VEQHLAEGSSALKCVKGIGEAVGVASIVRGCVASNCEESLHPRKGSPVPSTACTCISTIGDGQFTVIVVDPECRLHGAKDAVAEPG
jgi:hypothetical protein